LKTATSMAPTSRSMLSTSAIICSSRRASEPKARALPPAASMLATSGASLSAVRRVTQAVKAFACKPARNGAAGGVAGADHERDFRVRHPHP